jgi:hypothetical protein
MKRRVIIFLDYQNVIKRAYAYYAKNLDKPNIVSQINPSKLGDQLMRKYTDTRELKQIRIYTGIPSERKDIKAFIAASKRIESWQSDPLVKVITRPHSQKGLGTKLLDECAISWHRNREKERIVTSAEFAISA